MNQNTQFKQKYHIERTKETQSRTKTMVLKRIKIQT